MFAGGVWERGRPHVLSAALSVLHQRALLSGDPPSAAASVPSAVTASGAEVAPSPAASEQSQCTPPQTDGSSGTDSGQKQNVASADGVVTSEGPDGEVVNVENVVGAQGARKGISADGDAGGASTSDVDLAGCVRRLKSLYVCEKTEEEERMFAELEQRLAGL